MFFFNATNNIFPYETIMYHLLQRIKHDTKTIKQWYLIINVNDSYWQQKLCARTLTLYLMMSFLCTFGSSLTFLDCSFYVSFFKFTYIHKFCRWGKEQCDIHTKNVGNCVRWLLKVFRPNINMYLKSIQIDEVKPSIFIYFSTLKCWYLPGSINIRGSV